MDALAHVGQVPQLLGRGNPFIADGPVLLVPLGGGEEDSCEVGVGAVRVEAEAERSFSGVGRLHQLTSKYQYIDSLTSLNKRS